MIKAIQDMEDYDLFIYPVLGNKLCCKVDHHGNFSGADGYECAAINLSGGDTNSLCVFRGEGEFEVIGNLGEGFKKFSDSVLQVEHAP